VSPNVADPKASAPRNPKVAIVGAGSVGATIAYASVIRGVAKHIVLYDVDAAKTRAEELDLNHGIQFVEMARIEGSSDVAICAGADVVVVTAGAKQKPGQSRIDLAQANCAILKTIVPAIVELAPGAILLLVTNPVDVMTYAALKLSGFPPRRVFGSGTVLDSSRLRFLIARRLDVAVQNVHAYIAGEHGDSEVALWGSATAGGVPLEDWDAPGRAKLRARDRTEIHASVKNAAYEIIRGKGATNYAIGLATARILEAVLHDENSVLPVSSLLDGYRGIRDVCLSVPCVLNRRGVEAHLPVPLAPAEEEALKVSAETVRGVVRGLGF